MTATQQIGVELGEETVRKLAELPSATTMGERQVAHYWTSKVWDGNGDVFENGPLLGGATRALGTGMMANEHLSPDSHLRTYDWFSLAAPLDLPDDVWAKLIGAGMLTDDQVSRAHAEGTFLPLFVALHREERYWRLLWPEFGWLPGHRGQGAPDGVATFSLDDYRGEFALAFVDGCKSWYGTKHWFREFAPRARPGTDVLFQDFGHSTCFWLPSLVATFRDRFELLAYVDHTYVWRLHDPPTADEVEEAFPDEPTDLSRDVYHENFGWLVKAAATRGDAYGTLSGQLHHAAALAYIGLGDEARSIFNALLMKADYLPWREYIKARAAYPTYTPEGKVTL